MISNQPSTETIRTIAYQLWESEGKPEGQDYRHWIMAEEISEREAGSAETDDDETNDYATTNNFSDDQNNNQEELDIPDAQLYTTDTNAAVRPLEPIDLLEPDEKDENTERRNQKKKSRH